MGIAGGIQEGSYASSNNLPIRGMINRELGLTLLPGSQISRGLPDPLARDTQVAFTDPHSGSHSEEALDLKSLIGRPHSSENAHPASSTSTSGAGEWAGTDIQDVDLSSFQVPSIEDFSLDWCFGELEMPTLHGSSSTVAPANFDVEVGGICGSQQSNCLTEPSLESQQSDTEVLKVSDTERFVKSDNSYSPPSWEALTTGSPTTSSNSLFIQGKCGDKSETFVQFSPTTNNGFELQLHKLEQKINDLTKSLQLTNKELEDERAEKQKLKKKAKSLVKLLRECAPGKVPVARLLKDVGKIPLDDDDNAGISHDPSPSPNSADAISRSRHQYQGQVSPAPVEAQANENAVPSPSPATTDLTTDDKPSFISPISPVPSDPPPHIPSLRDHDSTPLATLHSRLEKRPLNWLEGSHPVTGAKRQKSLDSGICNIQALEVANEVRQATSDKDARILRRKEVSKARNLKYRLKKKAEKDAKEGTEAQRKKASQRTRKGQTESKDYLTENAGQMIKPNQGQVQGTETTLGRQDRTPHARLPLYIDTLSHNKYNSPHSQQKYPSSVGQYEDLYGLAAELEKAMEAVCQQGSEVSDGLGAELESAMAADETQSIYSDDRLGAEIEAAMLDEDDAKKEELGAELDATTMATGKGHENDGDGGPNT